MMKKLFILLGILSLNGCYVCPTGDTEVTGKYKIYRDAACEAVEGCDPAFMARVKVYEAPKNELKDICNQSSEVLGCYCGEMDCLTIVLAPEYVGLGTALHEYIHAAIDSADIESKEEDIHDLFFWESYRKAAAIIEQSLNN